MIGLICFHWAELPSMDDLDAALASDFPSVDEWKVDGNTVTAEEIHVREALHHVSSEETNPSLTKSIDNEEAVDAGRNDEDDDTAEEEYTIVQGKCPICLKNLVRGVLVKGCLHEFCFHCISQWAHHLSSRHAPVMCPICRTSFRDVLANLRSATDYDVVDVLDASKSRENSSVRARFMVYRRRRSSPSFASTDSASSWLPIWKTNVQGKAWIDRELHVLLGDEADTSLLLHIIWTYLDKARQHDQEARTRRQSAAPPSAKRLKSAPLHPYDSLCGALGDFLDEDATLFVHEVSKFMGSRLNMATYDCNSIELPKPENAEFNDKIC
ncbi:Aste57867_18820 [Aphanomyces stellatus]|uniref:Aste57867_18820 protein n=1 Tax=Aphanomyces stellatus TaxID=120398 RepID=A0A485LB34_9STRA|nr:hypothetical protein As57867_018756 [Aphanomyces stellatus]VFT95554.1 Aste57867_18820 [Aphanomyces stellatus]